MRKNSTSCQSETITEEAISETPAHLDGRKKLEFVKSKVKQLIRSSHEDRQIEHAKTLISQGRLLELLHTLEMDATWKKYLYCLPKGVLKFILNSSINTLPTKANLKLWGKRSNDKCPLCGWKETTNHILSSCPKALEQGRYTFRHNRVLKEIVDKIDTNRFKVYSDIEGFKIGGGTIPPDIIVTAEKPDLVMIDPLGFSGKPWVTIVELTCPWEERLDQARTHKTDKYASLFEDIRGSGHGVTYIPLEVGVRGIMGAAQKEAIKSIADYTTSGKPKELMKALSLQAITSSYYIFLNRRETIWTTA